MQEISRYWHDKMHDFSLVVIVLLFTSAQLAASANTLLNFEFQGTETFLAASDDGSSGAINLSTPFVFYGKQQTSVFVSPTVPII